jgi:hypothetical protein
MTLNTAFAPHLNKNIKFGRVEPVARAAFSLKLRHFLLAGFTVPESTTYRTKADPVLREIYGNDELGDCLPAAHAHLLGEVTGVAGAVYSETLTQVKADYHGIGGYVDGDPSTDNGCDEETARNYYMKNGFANGVKPLGVIDIDAENPDEVAAAMFLFENVVFCAGMPAEWISPFPDKDGFVWSVAGDPVPKNGHCYMGVDKDKDGIIIDSWALEGLFTFSGIAKYCSPARGGSCFAYLMPNQLAKGMDKAPNGVAWSELVAAFDKYGGHVPLPAPPTPVGPPPGVTPTAAQVDAAIAHAIATAPGFGPFVSRTVGATAAAKAVNKLYNP